MTMIIRNAFGGAYAAYNSHYTGADLVFAMPMARVAVMGAAGKDFVFKDEMRAIAAAHKKALKGGASEADANRDRDASLAALTTRYEDQLMNPKEALSLGSVSRIVMPGESRRILARNLDFLMRKYTPGPMGGPNANTNKQHLVRRCIYHESPQASNPNILKNEKRNSC